MTLFNQFAAWWLRVTTLYDIEHITASELVRPERGVPPKELWPNILTTAWIVNSLREHFDVPVHITSAYRSPAYNEEVGGSTNSRHTAFNAIDFWIEGVDPRTIQQFLRDDQKVAAVAGIGSYEGFTHLDTRALVFPDMSPAQWDG